MIYELYRGPSVLNGEPVTALVTGVDAPSRNPKTGPMAQVWILRADMHPMEALRTGADEAICGQCPLRRDVCYVNVGLAPATVWRTWKAGKSKVVAPEKLCSELSRRGLAVRVGAYGDPLAIPMMIWHRLLWKKYVRHVGYTHQWQTHVPLEEMAKRYFMASVESAADAAKARNQGWSTFRIYGMDEEIHPGDITCPASAEAGWKTTCSRCRLCSGNTSRSRGIAIRIHGSKNKVRNYQQLETP